MTTVSPCIAHYRLLAAIFGKDPDDLLRHKGLLRPPFPQRRCRSCGAGLAEGDRVWYCPACRLIPVACDWCGEITWRKRAEVLSSAQRQKYAYAWCNHSCQGKWLGTHYGFALYPEHQGGRKPGPHPEERKWDWDMVWAEQERTGLNGYQLAKMLGMPFTTVYHILRKKWAEHGQH